MVGKYKAHGSDEERKIPATHIASFSGVFSKFQKTAGLSFWNASDLNIINAEAPRRAHAYRRHKRQDAQIPFSVLERGVPRLGGLKTRMAIPTVPQSSGIRGLKTERPIPPSYFSFYERMSRMVRRRNQNTGKVRRRTMWVFPPRSKENQ